uniref:Translocase of outer mitochondrial membrane 40 like n=1 Tax=Canis lupus familiaris TaxID=9615 RepID=A0A8C0SHC8_CANLF
PLDGDGEHTGPGTDGGFAPPESPSRGASAQPWELRRAAPALQRCVPSTDGGSKARGQQGSEQPFPGGSHRAHECPGPARLPPPCGLCRGLATQPHRGVPHRGRGYGQQRQPQRPGPAPLGRAAPRQGCLPGDPGFLPPPPEPGCCSGLGARGRSRAVVTVRGGRQAFLLALPPQTQQAKFLTWQFDGEYRGDDYTATLTLGNPDLIGESVIMVAHFLQSLTHRLVLGGELVYHRRPGEEGAILTLAGKYSAVHWVATLNVGSGGAHASYYHRANEQVQVGVEFEANTRLQDTTFSFGYHLTLPQANMVFRGLVDSNWCVGAVLEKKMPPLPVTLALGAFLNHWRNRFHCGFSITVG